MFHLQEALCDEPREECEGQDRAENDAPRFTLQELRDVLQERNELKAQVFVLQEELAYYKRLHHSEMLLCESLVCCMH